MKVGCDRVSDNVTVCGAVADVHAPAAEPAINGDPYYPGYSEVRNLGGKGYKYGAAAGLCKMFDMCARECMTALWSGAGWI